MPPTTPPTIAPVCDELWVTSLLLPPLPGRREGEITMVFSTVEVMVSPAAFVVLGI